MFLNVLSLLTGRGNDGKMMRNDEEGYLKGSLYDDDGRRRRGGIGSPV